MNPLAYVLAIASSTAFAGASLIFTEVSRRSSPLWMNAFKAIVAWLLFLITVTVFNLWLGLPPVVIFALILSGVLGLAVADIFLLTAYVRMGSARTLILYGFQPFFLGIAAHFLFHQPMNWMSFLAVIFFVCCLITFSLEKYRSEGHWELPGLIAALVGVLFDNTGVVISRWAFEQVPAMDAFQANFWRCTGAIAFFAVFSMFGNLGLRAHWRAFPVRWRLLALASTFLGTFLSLALYLTAVKIGHLMTLSAVGVAGPIISSAMECIYYRKRPSRYLLLALTFFFMGFAALTWL